MLFVKTKEERATLCSDLLKMPSIDSDLDSCYFGLSPDCAAQTGSACVHIVNQLEV